MTDEAAFQMAIDEFPDFWGNRAVFADWLEEQGDWRAEGYRWLGTHRRRPYMMPLSSRAVWGWHLEGSGDVGEPSRCDLPLDLFEVVALIGSPASIGSAGEWVTFSQGRIVAEQAVCLAVEGWGRLIAAEGIFSAGKGAVEKLVSGGWLRTVPGLWPSSRRRSRASGS